MSTTDTHAAEGASDIWDEVRDLAPSAKLVAKILAYEGTLTQNQLADETLLPPRTVRHALAELEDVDAVESRISFTDARKRCYSLANEEPLPNADSQ